MPTRDHECNGGAYMEITQKAAWATLLTDEKYLPGLAVFAKSLLEGSANHRGSRYPLIAMITSEASQELVEACRSLGCLVRPVKKLDPGPSRGKDNLAFAHFGKVWTKLRAFDLVEYDKIVLVDSDMLVLQNMDELMDYNIREDQIMATFACTCNPSNKTKYPKEWNPANCAYTPQKHPENTFKGMKITLRSRPTHHLLNSGLVVLKPSRSIMKDIEARIQNDPIIDSYHFPDQDLLADHFRGKLIPLPYTYNALKKVRGCHPQLWRDEYVKNIHYILDKPWNSSELDEDDAVTHQWWWNVYRANEWPESVSRYVTEPSSP